MEQTEKINTEIKLIQKGQKGGNLLRIKSLFEDKEAAKEKEELKYSVPNFIIISTDEIVDFLKDNKFNIIEAWNELLEKLNREDDPINLIDFETELSDICQKIDKAFKNPSSKSKLNLINKINSNSFDQYLIIRSNGIEDGLENCNAGGNETVPYINKDNTNEVLQAINEVLQSYFSIKSLKQRTTLSNDKEKILAELNKLCLSILAQEMIVKETRNTIENKNLNPLISGNILSQEPDGNTSEVALIVAGYGHEAGTNANIPFDKYYIDKNNYIFSIIYKKFFRQEPRKDKSNILNWNTISNDSELVTRNCLERNSILALKAITKRISDDFRDIVEIEFIIHPAKKIIYILQARPYKSRAISIPSYLNEEALKNNETFPTKIITSGELAVLTLDSKENCIIMHSIDAALIEYLELSDKDKVKCILITQEPAALSHPVITFRAYKKPIVLISTDFYNRIIKHWQTLIIDFQRQKILYQRMSQSVQTINGWFSHPISMELSTISLNDNQYLNNLHALDFTDLPKEISENSISKILEELYKIKNQNQMEDLTKSLLYKIACFEKIYNSHTDSIPLIKFMAHYLFYLSTIEWEKLDNIEKLFYINWLKACLYQDKNNTLASSSSIKQILSQVKFETKIRKEAYSTYIIDPTEDNIQIIKLLPYALNKNIKNNYAYFIKAIRDKNTRNILNNTIYFLAKFDMLFDWLNNCFIEKKTFKEYEEELIRNFIILSNNKFKLVFLYRFKNQLSKPDNYLFDSPEEIQIFSELINYPFFKELINHENIIMKNMAKNYLHSLLEAIDKSIKLLKLRTFSSENLNCIKEYINIFRNTVNNLLTLLKDRDNECRNKLKEYLDYASISIKDKNIFDPSSSFNVTWFLAELTSKKNHDKASTPNTLEDEFTLIHQYGLFLLSKIGENTLITNEHLPKKLNTVANALKKAGSEIYTKYKSYGSAGIYLISTQYRFPNLNLFYNCPLRHHAITIILNYDMLSEDTIIEITLNANNEFNRNIRAKVFLEAFLVSTKDFNQISLSSSDNNLFFQAKVDGINSIDRVLDIITKISFTLSFKENKTEKTKNLIRLEDSSLQNYNLNEAEKQMIADYVLKIAVNGDSFHPLLPFAMKHCSAVSDNRLYIYKIYEKIHSDELNEYIKSDNTIKGQARLEDHFNLKDLIDYRRFSVLTSFLRFGLGLEETKKKLTPWLNFFKTEIENKSKFIKNNEYTIIKNQISYNINSNLVAKSWLKLLFSYLVHCDNRKSAPYITALAIELLTSYKKLLNTEQDVKTLLGSELAKEYQDKTEWEKKFYRETKQEKIHEFYCDLILTYAELLDILYEKHILNLNDYLEAIKYRTVSSQYYCYLSDSIYKMFNALLAKTNIEKKLKIIDIILHSDYLILNGKLIELKESCTRPNIKIESYFICNVISHLIKSNSYIFEDDFSRHITTLETLYMWLMKMDTNTKSSDDYERILIQFFQLIEHFIQNLHKQICDLSNIGSSSPIIGLVFEIYNNPIELKKFTNDDLIRVYNISRKTLGNEFLRKMNDNDNYELFWKIFFLNCLYIKEWTDTPYDPSDYYEQYITQPEIPNRKLEYHEIVFNNHLDEIKIDDNFQDNLLALLNKQVLDLALVVNQFCQLICELNYCIKISDFFQLNENAKEKKILISKVKLLFIFVRNLLKKDLEKNILNNFSEILHKYTKEYDWKTFRKPYMSNRDLDLQKNAFKNEILPDANELSKQISELIKKNELPFEKASHTQHIKRKANEISRSEDDSTSESTSNKKSKTEKESKQAKTISNHSAIFSSNTNTNLHQNTPNETDHNNNEINSPLELKNKI